MARAVLEGVAFGMRDSIEIMRGMGIPINEVRISGVVQGVLYGGKLWQIYVEFLWSY
jgi:glycerol kinase